jgi:hypothetical protein
MVFVFDHVHYRIFLCSANVPPVNTECICHTDMGKTWPRIEEDLEVLSMSLHVVRLTEQKGCSMAKPNKTQYT